MSDLSEKKCVPCEGGIPALDKNQAEKMLGDLNQWDMNDTATEINKTFHFKNYYETMAFVNALAWLSHQENHHPDLEVCYSHCQVRYSTHAIGGLSENDFICATKVDTLW